jgi:hypothetical protein
MASRGTSKRAASQPARTSRARRRPKSPRPFLRRNMAKSLSGSQKREK